MLEKVSWICNLDWLIGSNGSRRTLPLLHAFACINLNANQIISGTAINMIAGSLTVYLARNITGSGNIHIVNGLSRKDIPLLVDIPIIGKLFLHKPMPVLGLCYLSF